VAKPVPHFGSEDIQRWLPRLARPHHAQYFAMYSSVLDGIVTDPRLMLVPADDHMVHRGDGVFETVKCVNGSLYNLHAHLARLAHSAQALSLSPPLAEGDLADVLVQTIRAGGRPDCLVRILVSRGPGGLGVNPYECPRSALYVVVSELKKPFMAEHPQGARVRASRLPPKPAPFAGIKSVNYALNVLMKKEAVDGAVDFVVSFDERGGLAEGATENAGIVTRDRVLRVPRPDRILVGTTMTRVLELAASRVADGLLRRIEHADIPRDDVARAAEMLIFGTTPDVTAAVEFEGRAIADGKPGPVFRALSGLLLEDIRSNARLHTRVF
jgi:branched-chain amino acid aminotransferase